MFVLKTLTPGFRGREEFIVELTPTYSQVSFLLVNMKMNRLRHLLKHLHFFIAKLIVQDCTPSEWVLQWEIMVAKTTWRRWSLIVSKKNPKNNNNMKGPPHYSLSPKCHRVHIETINPLNSSGQQGSSGDKIKARLPVLALRCLHSTRANVCGTEVACKTITNLSVTEGLISVCCFSSRRFLLFSCLNMCNRTYSCQKLNS